MSDVAWLQSSHSHRPAHVPDLPGAGPGPGPDRRLAWLDALRGIGALMVALHHAGPRYLPELSATVLRYVNPGTYGVIVFFLVSGYIIPASLERSGSLRRFWVGRICRLCPLLCVALAATALLVLWGPGRLREGLGERDPLSALVAHGTMLQDLLGVPNAINVLWTLSYEMVFYFLVAALFALRLHRRSASMALGLAALGIAAGGMLPVAALSRGLGGTTVIAATALGAAVALCAVALGRAPWNRAGALLGGALAAVLILFNGRIPPWQGIALLSLMFTGTVLYRMERGQLGRAAGPAVAATVLAAAVLSAALHIGSRPDAVTGGSNPESAVRIWAVTAGLALLTFGAAMALRRHRVPRWLAHCGVLSYSLYLLHPLVLEVCDLAVPWQQHDTPLLMAAYLALLLPLAMLAHRLVELPGQRVGRVLAGPLGGLPLPRGEQRGARPAALG
ncbi:acyltransferase family protein [Streptomyces violens]|uniref:acyltransferase family protein n=1 Tax=Streptomyces violens TaxID=66377 RepID=UPI000997308D|nr:acyltransferase [Streptomyces violens]